MSAELTTGIPFRIPAGTEVQETVTTEGLYIIPPHDLPARVLLANEQKYPTVIAVEYLQINPKDPKDKTYLRGYLPFPDGYRPQVIEILEKMKTLFLDKKSTPSNHLRLRLQSEVQIAIADLEQLLPQNEDQINPVIFGLRAGFNEYLDNPGFDPF